MESDALGVPRARLRGAGIITDTAHGYLAFTVPGFARHVRRHFGIDAAGEDLGRNRR